MGFAFGTVTMWAGRSNDGRYGLPLCLIQVAARRFIKSHFLDNFPEKLLNPRKSSGVALHLLPALRHSHCNSLVRTHGDLSANKAEAH